MNKKSLFAVLLLGAFVLLASSAYADPLTEGCMSGHGIKKGCGTAKCETRCPVADKFLRKAHFILERKADLSLTEEQVKTIKDLKLQVEKENIRQSAERKTTMLDLKEKLQADKVDVEGANALIDKMSAGSSASMKANIEAYAKLKGVLTPDQAAKMKEIWKNKRK